MLVMTCAVRDGAEQKIWNRLEYLKSLKKKRSKHKAPFNIGILGKAIFAEMHIIYLKAIQGQGGISFVFCPSRQQIHINGKLFQSRLTGVTLCMSSLPWLNPAIVNSLVSWSYRMQSDDPVANCLAIPDKQKCRTSSNLINL